MRQRITIQVEGLTADGGGGAENTWAAHGNDHWAQVTPLSGTKGLHAMQLRQPVTHEIWIRKTDIPAGARILYGTRPLSIVSAINVEEGDWYTVIMAHENVAT